MPTFSERLKEARKARGVTQKAAANFLGITEQAYQKYEYAMREPDHKTTIRLAEFYHVSVDYLMGRTDETALFNMSKRIAEISSDARLSLECKGLYVSLLQCVVGNRAIVSNEKLFLQENNLTQKDFMQLLQCLENLKYIYIIDSSEDNITNQRHFILL
jgi:transcriptional regulator with XRE-family HTH domain